jgi:uncharacterized protein YceK
MNRLFQYCRLTLVVCCAAAALAGCATVSKTMSADQMKSLKYVGTHVTFAPDAQIWWGDGERAYAVSKGLAVTESETVAKTLGAQAYLRNQISSKVKAAMARHLTGSLKGSRPVRVDVVVKSVVIASAAQRVILGGGSTVQGEIKLVDAQTGAVLQSHPAWGASAAAGQGIAQVLIENAIAKDEPIDRVIDNFALGFRNWLVPA